MRIAFNLNAEDLIEAQRNHGGWRTKAIPAVGLLLILAGVSAIALNPKQNAGGIVPILIGLYLIFGLRLGIRRSFKQDARLQQPFEAVISRDGIDVSSPTGCSKFAWSAFTRFIETKNLFLVYQAPAVFNAFPKRAFAPGDEESFRSLLSERLGMASAAYSKRISPSTWLFLAVVAMTAVLLVIAIHNIR